MWTAIATVSAKADRRALDGIRLLPAPRNASSIAKRRNRETTSGRCGRKNSPKLRVRSADEAKG